MAEQQQKIIQRLRRRWLFFSIAGDTLIAAGTGLLLAFIVHGIHWPYAYGLLFFIGTLALLVGIHRSWQISDADVCRFLNQRYPELEESSALLLRPSHDLNTLERIQYRRTATALEQIRQPFPAGRKLLSPVLIAACMLATGYLLYAFPRRHHGNGTSVSAVHGIVRAPEKHLAAIEKSIVDIIPPAYTGKRPRQQEAFNMAVEEGALVQWRLQTTNGAAHVQFVFNGNSRSVLNAANDQRTSWIFKRRIDSTGFYQVSINGELSEMYTLECIPDRAPSVVIQKPAQYTTIDIGEPQQVRVAAAVTDDYGVLDTKIIATIASGTGEAVSFKEHAMPWASFAAGKSKYDLQQLISLPQLGMHAGDELYFYVEAADNHHQQTRSDVYIVHLPDTAQLMSLEGLGNSLSVKPEYFRSQRQIIIETEQLLKDKDTISEETFHNRSNNLGIDQKLLRLRYGKFLGDENESGEPIDHDLDNPADFSNADKLRDAYTDKHDNAEDATFYEPETKKQLRATLNEMWNAEIKLRTFTPQAALPFEYKALRLLKDLQQKSRAYVAKTNFKTTPLDPAKRLTGDKSAIDVPVDHKQVLETDDAMDVIRQALSELERMRSPSPQAKINLPLLQKADLILHQHAVAQPGRFVRALDAMNRMQQSAIAQQTIQPRDILIAEQGLQQLIAQPDPLPTSGEKTTSPLSKLYFHNLQKKQP